LPVERTVSRRGGHAATGLVIVIRRNGEVETLTSPQRAGGARTYTRGYSGVVDLDLSRGDVAVHVWLVKNPRGHVRGVIRVINDEGVEVLRAVYRRLKVRFSRGDPSYSWAVEEAMRILRLEKYVRKYTWPR